MNKFSLSLTPLLSVQFWQGFNLETLLPYLPSVVSILIYLVYLLTWRHSTKSVKRLEFSQIYQKISDVFLEIRNLYSAFVSLTDQPSQLSDLTTSASQSPEPEPVQQPAQEPEPPQEVPTMFDCKNVKDCPIFTCPFNLGGDFGCSLNKCAYFCEPTEATESPDSSDSSSIKISSSIGDLVVDIIKRIEEELK